MQTNNRLRDFVNGFLYERDKAELALADVLDIKASIVLVIITFMATLVDKIAPGHSPPVALTIAGVITVLSLGFSGVFTLLALWPLTYSLEAKPGDIEERLVEMCSSFKADPDKTKDTETAVLEHAIERHKIASMRRVDTNYALNRKKAGYLRASFYGLLPAISIEVGLLVIRAISAAAYVRGPF